MLRKDYLMKQMEEFGKVLALILGFKKEKDWEKFEQEMANAMQRFTAMDLREVEALSLEDFALKVLENKNLSQEQKKIMAALLFEKMTHYLEVYSEEKAVGLQDKCLLLYQHLRNNFTEHEFDLNVHYRLNVLTKMAEERGNTSL